MLSPLLSYLFVMLGLIFDFAQIRAADIPEGVMPKRQVVGTGVTTSTEAEATPTEDTGDNTAEPTTTEPPPETTEEPTEDATTTTTPETTAATTPTPTEDPTSDGEQTTEADPTTEPTTEATSSPDDPTPTSDDSTDDEAESTPATTEGPTATSASDNDNADDDGTTQDEDNETTGGAGGAASASSVPTTVDVTTTDSSGNTVTSRLATSTAAQGSARQSDASNTIFVTQSGSSSNFVAIGGSSTINRSTLSEPTTITSALLALETEPFTTTSFFTDEEGQRQSSVYTTDRVVSSTTGFATATIHPSLQNGSGSSGSGLSDSSKKIIGGVVGGVGGAVLIGGLAIFAWRLWSKKKRERAEAEDDFLDSRDDSIHREKRDSVATPLRGNGDAYTNPGGNVNASSNF
ncbi:hypothetical protein MBLNU230_g6311t1 [Neophaeotheca triangularis]